MTATLDLDRLIEREDDRAERSADLDRRDREHGGMRSLPIELEEESKRRSTAGWLSPYKASAKPEEVAAAKRGEPARDARAISVGRLERDVRKAVARWSKLSRQDDRELLQSDALWLLLMWPEHGSTPSDEYPDAGSIDLGGRRALQLAELRSRREPNRARAVTRYLAELERIAAGSLPMRRDWLDLDNRDRDGLPMCSRRAQNALRAAVKQSLSTRYWRAERAHAKQEEPSGDLLDLDALLDQEEQESAEPVHLPDDAAPEVIAMCLDLPLDAGRAIVAQHERLAHETGALREQWKMTASAYPVAISRGSTIVRSRFPNPSDLLAELERLPSRYRELCERGAILALLDYRDGWIERERAASAVEEWRGAVRMMSERERAHLAAARRALQRAALRELPMWASVEQRLAALSHYGSERAERIAESAPLLLAAELRRKRYGLARTADLDRTYPGASWRVERGRVIVRAAMSERSLLSPELRRKRASWQGELIALLEKDSTDAHRIAELRRKLDPERSPSPEPARIAGALAEQGARAPRTREQLLAARAERIASAAQRIAARPRAIEVEERLAPISLDLVRRVSARELAEVERSLAEPERIAGARAIVRYLAEILDHPHSDSLARVRWIES